MRPLGWLADRLAERYSTRTLARATVLLFVALLVTQGGLAWYFGNVGLSLREVSHDADDRTVVIDRADVTTFERHYDEDVEEGWCLYGSTNRTHVRIRDVVHAEPLSQADDRIEFTCVPETAERLVGGGSLHLVGVVHSHPSHDVSEPSRVDTMTWGRVSPLVDVMGIYTEDDGAEFFTTRSLVSPLAKRVVE